MEILITVDRADAAWHGRVGVVPVLFNRLQIDPERTVVLTCGPEILMRFTVTEALNRASVRSRHLLLDGAEHAVRGRACAATASSGRRSSARTAPSSRTASSLRSFARSCSDRNSRLRSPESHEAMTTSETTIGRLQVRVVRRLPALAPGLRGPVAGGGRSGRDRLFPRGHPPAARGRIRRGPGGRVGLDARPGGGDPRHPPAQPIPDHPGGLCLARRDPGPAQLRQPERRERPWRSCMPRRNTSRRWPARGRPAHYVPVDLELPGCPINKHQLLGVLGQMLAGSRPKVPNHCALPRVQAAAPGVHPGGPRRPVHGAGHVHRVRRALPQLRSALLTVASGPAPSPTRRRSPGGSSNWGSSPRRSGGSSTTFYANAPEFKEEGQRHVEPTSTAG